MKNIDKLFAYDFLPVLLKFYWLTFKKNFKAPRGRKKFFNKSRKSVSAVKSQNFHLKSHALLMPEGECDCASPHLHQWPYFKTKLVTFVLDVSSFDSKLCNADYRASIHPQSMFQSYARDNRHENQLLSTCIITGSIHCESRIFLRKKWLQSAKSSSNNCHLWLPITEKRHTP